MPIDLEPGDCLNTFCFGETIFRTSNASWQICDLRLLDTSFPPTFPTLNATDIAKHVDDLCRVLVDSVAGWGRHSSFMTLFPKRMPNASWLQT